MYVQLLESNLLFESLLQIHSLTASSTFVLVALANGATECPVCTEHYNVAAHLPHVLPCAHNVCGACLPPIVGKAVRGKFACPVCCAMHPARVAVPVNYALRDILSALKAPEHSHRLSASGGASSSSAQELKSALPPACPCDECLEPVSAALFCTECKSLLCDAHITAHRKARTTHAHTLVATSERSNSASSSGSAKARCAVHGDQWISFFCKEHDVAVCDRCGILNHKQCTLVDIGDAALLSDQRQQIEKLIRSASTDVTAATTLVDALKVCRQSHAAAVESFVNDLHKRVDDIRGKLWTDYDNAMSALVSKVETVSNTVPLKVKEAQELLNTQQLPRLLAMKPQLKAALPVDLRKSLHSYLDTAVHSVQAVPGLALKVTSADWMGQFELGWGVVRLRNNLRPVHQTLLPWGSFGSRADQFKNPCGIALNAGLIYVADTDNDRICVFSRERNLVRMFSVGTTAKVSGPVGVAISDGLVYVVDRGNRRVCVFQLDGRFLRSWGPLTGGDDKPMQPWGIAACDDMVYVTDTNQSRLQIYKHDGTFVRDITSAGGVTLNRPLGVAVSNGSVFVVDSGNHRVCVFLADGTFVSSWGSQGNGPGQFLSASGVAVCKQVVYITDRVNRRIVICLTNGVYLTSVNSLGFELQTQLDFTCIAVAEDVIYGTNQALHCASQLVPAASADINATD